MLPCQRAATKRLLVGSCRSERRMRESYEEEEEDKMKTAGKLEEKIDLSIDPFKSAHSSQVKSIQGDGCWPMESAGV